METPENSSKRSVPDNDKSGDSLEQTVSPLARRLVGLIRERGPKTIRQLMTLGPFNYSTINPVLQELVEKGFLSRDDKTGIGSGGPLYFHITNDGMLLSAPVWETMTILEKLHATHHQNYHDLGIFFELERFVSNQQSREAMDLVRSVVTGGALNPAESSRSILVYDGVFPGIVRGSPEVMRPLGLRVFYDIENEIVRTAHPFRIPWWPDFW